MTAEKGEHERAPSVGESYLTPLRATLRAPPSKWAIKAFFRRVSAASRGRGQPRRGYRRPKPTARSDVGRLRSRRAACFLWYFLSLRKKVRPPSGRKPHCSRRSRRVNPPESVSFRQSWRTLMLTVGFPLAPCSRCKSTTQWSCKSHPAPESARYATGWGLLPAKLVYSVTSRGLSSGQTTGAACTVVCSACCLAERRAVPLGNFQTL